MAEQEVGQSPGAQRRRKWARPVASVALIAIVVAFGAFALLRWSAPGIGGSALGLTPIQVAIDTANWRSYQDPLDLFSVRLAPTWAASGGVDGAFSEGGSSGSDSGQSEDITFTRALQGGDGASLEIQLDQINSDAGRQWYCQTDTPTAFGNTSFNGYSAQVMQPGAVWLIDSQTAHFQIDVAIPNVVVPASAGGVTTVGTPAPTPTSLPQSIIQRDEAALADMLGSFHPTAPPLTCS
jgi:hypothetical protein